MSILFEPMKIGQMQVQNRFVRSATYEGMAQENGQVSDILVNMYQGKPIILYRNICFNYDNLTIIKI